MAMAVSPEVAKLFQVLTGEEWPDADEDQLRALAAEWSAAAQSLGALGPGLRSAVAAIRANFAGQAERAFAERIAPFVEGDNLIATATQLFDELANALLDLALNVEYMKLVIILSLIALIAEIAWAIAMSPFTAGASMAWLAARFAVVRFMIQTLLRRIILQVIQTAVFSIAFQLLIDVAAQLIQYAMGTRTEWNKKFTANAAGVGAMGAALALPIGALGKLLSGGLNNFVTNIFTKNLIKNTTEIATEAFHETLTEALYKYATEGEFEMNPYAATSGAASGGGKIAGDSIGNSLFGNNNESNNSSSNNNRSTPPPNNTTPNTDSPQGGSNSGPTGSQNNTPNGPTNSNTGNPSDSNNNTNGTNNNPSDSIGTNNNQQPPNRSTTGQDNPQQTPPATNNTTPNTVPPPVTTDPPTNNPTNGQTTSQPTPQGSPPPSNGQNPTTSQQGANTTSPGNGEMPPVSQEPTPQGSEPTFPSNSQTPPASQQPIPQGADTTTPGNGEMPPVSQEPTPQGSEPTFPSNSQTPPASQQPIPQGANTTTPSNGEMPPVSQEPAPQGADTTSPSGQNPPVSQQPVAQGSETTSPSNGQMSPVSQEPAPQGSNTTSPSGQNPSVSQQPVAQGSDSTLPGGQNPPVSQLPNPQGSDSTSPNGQNPPVLQQPTPQGSDTTSPSNGQTPPVLQQPSDPTVSRPDTTLPNNGQSPAVTQQPTPQASEPGGQNPPVAQQPNPQGTAPSSGVTQQSNPPGSGAPVPNDGQTLVTHQPNVPETSNSGQNAPVTQRGVDTGRTSVPNVGGSVTTPVMQPPNPATSGNGPVTSTSGTQLPATTSGTSSVQATKPDVTGTPKVAPPKMVPQHKTPTAKEAVATFGDAVPERSRTIPETHPMTERPVHRHPPNTPSITTNQVTPSQETAQDNRQNNDEQNNRQDPNPFADRIAAAAQAVDNAAQARDNIASLLGPIRVDATKTQRDQAAIEQSTRDTNGAVIATNQAFGPNPNRIADAQQNLTNATNDRDTARDALAEANARQEQAADNLAAARENQSDQGIRHWGRRERAAARDVANAENVLNQADSAYHQAVQDLDHARATDTSRTAARDAHTTATTALTTASNAVTTANTAYTQAQGNLNAANNAVARAGAALNDLRYAANRANTANTEFTDLTNQANTTRAEITDLTTQRNDLNTQLTEIDNQLNEHTTNQPGISQATTNQPAGTQRGESQLGESQLGDYQRAGGQPANNQPAGTPRDGNQQGGNQRAGGQPANNQPAGSQRDGNQLGDNQRTGSQLGGNQPSGTQSGNDQRTGNHLGDNQPTESQQSGTGQPSNSQQAGNQAVVDQLNDQRGALNEQINDLNTRIETLTGQADNLDTQAAAAKTRYNNAIRDVTANLNRIDAHTNNAHNAETAANDSRNNAKDAATKSAAAKESAEEAAAQGKVERGLTQLSFLPHDSELHIETLGNRDSLIDGITNATGLPHPDVAGQINAMTDEQVAGAITDGKITISTPNGDIDVTVHADLHRPTDTRTAPQHQQPAAIKQESSRESGVPKSEATASSVPIRIPLLFTSPADLAGAVVRPMVYVGVTGKRSQKFESSTTAGSSTSSEQSAHVPTTISLTFSAPGNDNPVTSTIDAGLRLPNITRGNPIQALLPDANYENVTPAPARVPTTFRELLGNSTDSGKGLSDQLLTRNTQPKTIKVGGKDVVITPTGPAQVTYVGTMTSDQAHTTSHGNSWQTTKGSDANFGFGVYGGPKSWYVGGFADFATGLTDGSTPGVEDSVSQSGTNTDLYYQVDRPMRIEQGGNSVQDNVSGMVKVPVSVARDLGLPIPPHLQGAKPGPTGQQYIFGRDDIKSVNIDGVKDFVGNQVTDTPNGLSDKGRNAIADLFNSQDTARNTMYDAMHGGAQATWTKGGTTHIVDIHAVPAPPTTTQPSGQTDISTEVKHTDKIGRANGSSRTARVGVGGAFLPVGTDSPNPNAPKTTPKDGNPDPYQGGPTAATAAARASLAVNVESGISNKSGYSGKDGHAAKYEGEMRDYDGPVDFVIVHRTTPAPNWAQRFFLGDRLLFGPSAGDRLTGPAKSDVDQALAGNNTHPGIHTGRVDDAIKVTTPADKLDWATKPVPASTMTPAIYLGTPPPNPNPTIKPEWFGEFVNNEHVRVSPNVTAGLDITLAKRIEPTAGGPVTRVPPKGSGAYSTWGKENFVETRNNRNGTQQVTNYTVKHSDLTRPGTAAGDAVRQFAGKVGAHGTASQGFGGKSNSTGKMLREGRLIDFNGTLKGKAEYSAPRLVDVRPDSTLKRNQAGDQVAGSTKSWGVGLDGEISGGVIPRRDNGTGAMLNGVFGGGGKYGRSHALDVTVGGKQNYEYQGPTAFVAMDVRYQYSADMNLRNMFHQSDFADVPVTVDEPDGVLVEMPVANAIDMFTKLGLDVPLELSGLRPETTTQMTDPAHTLLTGNDYASYSDTSVFTSTLTDSLDEVGNRLTELDVKGKEWRAEIFDQIDTLLNSPAGNVWMRDPLTGHQGHGGLISVPNPDVVFEDVVDIRVWSEVASGPQEQPGVEKLVPNKQATADYVSVSDQGKKSTTWGIAGAINVGVRHANTPSTPPGQPDANGVVQQSPPNAGASSGAFTPQVFGGAKSWKTETIMDGSNSSKHTTQVDTDKVGRDTRQVVHTLEITRRRAPMPAFDTVGLGIPKHVNWDKLGLETPPATSQPNGNQTTTSPTAPNQTTGLPPGNQPNTGQTDGSQASANPTSTPSTSQTTDSQASTNPTSTPSTTSPSTGGNQVTANQSNGGQNNPAPDGNTQQQPRPRQVKLRGEVDLVSPSEKASPPLVKPGRAPEFEVLSGPRPNTVPFFGPDDGVRVESVGTDLVSALHDTAYAQLSDKPPTGQHPSGRDMADSAAVRSEYTRPGSNSEYILHNAVKGTSVHNVSNVVITGGDHKVGNILGSKHPAYDAMFDYKLTGDIQRANLRFDRALPSDTTMNLSKDNETATPKGTTKTVTTSSGPAVTTSAANTHNAAGPAPTTTNFGPPASETIGNDKVTAESSKTANTGGRKYDGRSYLYIVDEATFYSEVSRHGSNWTHKPLTAIKDAFGGRPHRPQSTVKISSFSDMKVRVWEKTALDKGLLSLGDVWQHASKLPTGTPYTVTTNTDGATIHPAGQPAPTPPPNPDAPRGRNLHVAPGVTQSDLTTFIGTLPSDMRPTTYTVPPNHPFTATDIQTAVAGLPEPATSDPAKSEAESKKSPPETPKPNSGKPKRRVRFALPPETSEASSSKHTPPLSDLEMRQIRDAIAEADEAEQHRPPSPELAPGDKGKKPAHHPTDSLGVKPSRKPEDGRGATIDNRDHVRPPQNQHRSPLNDLPALQKPSQSGSQRDLADAKRDGTIWDDRSLAPPPDTSTGNTPPPVVVKSHEEIAGWFSDALRKYELDPFLSGGAALGFQDGSRPIKDLDFRITAADAGFRDFGEPKGQRMLKYLNDIARKGLQQQYQKQRNSDPNTPSGGKVTEFFPLGGPGGSRTIGSPDILGHEVSVSVVPGDRPDTSRHGDFDVLTLPELRDDKLRTMISRTKTGDESVKKVAQDLFDLVDAMNLVDDSPDSTAQQVSDAIRARFDQYSDGNLDGSKLHHLSDQDLFDLMAGRAVLTARAHTQHGARHDAFQSIAVNAHDPAAINERLDRLAKLPVPPAVVEKLRPWMQDWNDPGSFGPPAESKGTGRPQYRPGALPGEMPGEETPAPPAVEQLLDIHADDIVANVRERLPKSTEDIEQVVRVLSFSGGFRELANSKSDAQTMDAFGMTQAKFGKAYKALHDAGLVEGSREGLSLTRDGWRLVPTSGPFRVYGLDGMPVYLHQRRGATDALGGQTDLGDNVPEDQSTPEPTPESRPGKRSRDDFESDDGPATGYEPPNVRPVPERLVEPTSEETAALLEVVPPGQKFTDPASFVDLINGTRSGQGRDVNCVDAALAFHATYHGEPRVAGSALDGLPRSAGTAAAEELGYAPELVGRGPGGLGEVIARVDRAGHGADALVFGFPRSGSGHAWNVVNYNGDVFLVDAQDGTITPATPDAMPWLDRVYAIPLDAQGNYVSDETAVPVPPVDPDPYATAEYERAVREHEIRTAAASGAEIPVPGTDGRLVPSLGGLRLVGAVVTASVAADLAAMSGRDVIALVIGADAEEDDYEGPPIRPELLRFPPLGRPEPISG